MKSLLLTGLTGVCVAMTSPLVANDGDDGAKALQGVWAAASMEADGTPAPAKDVERMRFTFKENKLLIRGNFRDDREQSAYKVDPKQSPKQLDFTPPKEQKPILGIYEVNGDELKVCLRHASSSDGRPTEFATKPDSKLVLIVFKKQKP